MYKQSDQRRSGPCTNVRSRPLTTLYDVNAYFRINRLEKFHRQVNVIQRWFTEITKKENSGTERRGNRYMPQWKTGLNDGRRKYMTWERGDAN